MKRQNRGMKKLETKRVGNQSGEQQPIDPNGVLGYSMSQHPHDTGDLQLQK